MPCTEKNKHLSCKQALELQTNIAWCPCMGIVKGNLLVAWLAWLYLVSCHMKMIWTLCWEHWRTVGEGLIESEKVEPGSPPPAMLLLVRLLCPLTLKVKKNPLLHTCVQSLPQAQTDSVWPSPMQHSVGLQLGEYLPVLIYWVAVWADRIYVGICFCSKQANEV